MRTKFLLATAVASIFACSAASAGQFNVWTYESGKRNNVTVSFAGDGVAQDAQLDLAIPAGYEFVEAKALVAGSVCAGSNEAGMLRAVPPSGAGQALPSAETDYCSFVIAAKGGIKPAGQGSVELKPRLTECAGAGSASCRVEVVDVSERGAAGREAASKPGQSRR